MLRLGSYGGSTSTTSHGHPKSPADPFPSPPLEAYPPPPTTRAKSTDILINRSHQLKRIAKGTATFYQGQPPPPPSLSPSSLTPSLSLSL